MSEQMHVTIEGVDGEEVFLFPASPAQQQMWFLDQLANHKPLYNIAAAVRLTGELNTELLQATLDELSLRHESLRTTFQMIDGNLMQVIKPEGTLPLVLHDKAGMHVAEVEQQAAIDAQVRFDLVKGPVVKADLYRLVSTEHLLVLSMQHIVTDGWSMSVLLEEMTALYDAAIRGVEAGLPELDIQYADYSEWQQEYLQHDVRHRLLDYWKRQLAGSEPLLAMPFDHLRPVDPSHKGGVHRFRLTREQVTGLVNLGQNEDATLFVMLMAAFQTLLYRYTHQANLLVGTPIANRNHDHLERVVGCVINTLVIRGDLTADLPFVELVRQIRDTMFDAYEHQDLPFGLLVEELQPERVHGVTPLFQNMLVLQNTPPARWELYGLKVEPVELHNGLAKFDLLLTAVEDQGELTCFFEYAEELYDVATIEQLTAHFLRLVDGILTTPELEIGRLQLLSEQEWEALTPAATSVLTPKADALLHQQFEQQALARPDAVAVVYEAETLTYRELNERANQLAHYLRARGVGPDVRVGISLNRSLEMLVAILGILKSGGAYVPLDPTIPQDRLAFIVEDADLSLLIVNGSSIECDARKVVQIDLNGVAALIAQEAVTTPENVVEPHHLAYVIYTSGSTGKPKGVMIPHQNVIRLFEATENWFAFDESDVWTLFHSYAFDFSVWEIWGALLHGGKLVVVPYVISRSPDAFYQLLLEQQVTVLNQTPSAFRQLVHIDVTDNERKALSLRYIVFGGEALELSMLSDWFEQYGDQQPRLINMYGITETTVHVTYRPITWKDLEHPNGSLIGKPIPDLSVHVLDALGQPVPVGVIGEMYVGGAGLAREYLNRPELTAECFVPHPNLPGERLYKTGDLARRLRNGDLEYKGRIDHQVKIRGFRIELGEIEWACLQHDEVREVFVTVREDVAGKRLIAYLVADARQDLVADVQRLLKAHLPEYMVPAVFVVLDQLPLNSNGKIDRKALDELDISTTDVATSDYVAPTTDQERLLCEVLSQVLELERVGIDDSFFALGGDSILSLRVQAEIRRRGYQLSLQDLFREPKLRTLAQTLKRQDASEKEMLSRVPFSMISPDDRTLLPEGLEDAYPATLLQLGMLYHSELQAGTPIYTNLHTYRLQAPFSVEAWAQSLSALVGRHPILRTSFDLNHFSQPLQLVHREASVPLMIKDLRGLSVEEQASHLAAHRQVETDKSLDWTQAPLLRVTLHGLSDEQFEIHLLEHHAILDGWSVASMFTELFKLYSAIVAEKTHSLLLAPASTYRDFVETELTALADDAQHTYWKQALAGAPVQELPRLDGEHRAMQPMMRVSEVDLPDGLSDQLKALANVLQVPIKSVLFAAHLAVMQTLGGSEDLVTGLVSNGRMEDADGERVLGLFLNTLPFRMQMTGDTWSGLIRRTFAQEQELLTYRRYPLAKIQEVVDSKKLFEVTFNFIHFHVAKELEVLDNVTILHNYEHSFDNHLLVANFMLDGEEKRVRLHFQSDGAQLSDAQLRSLHTIYRQALQHMVTDPEARFDEQCLLGTSEWNTVMVDWNETDIELPLNSTIHHWMEKQTVRTPDRIALQFEHEQLTYRELNERANQLAHTLLSRGGRREGLVGICMERSIEMVVALLGTLKAGMAYVPLDPAYPEDRLQYMLEDSQVAFILMHPNTRTLAEKLTSAVPLLDLTERDALQAGATDNPEVGVQADEVAYVLYTSGSTGRPKGVLVPHRGVVNRLLWGQGILPLTMEDRILQKTPYSFDVSVWEFFWPLFIGARLVVAKPGGHQDPDYLVRLIQQEAITTVHFVPTMLSYFLAASGVEACKTLQRVLCSGEELPVAIVERFFERMPEQVGLHNLYGPTEASVEVSYFECKRGEQRSRIPIGYPAYNTKLYILDRQMKPVPIGVPGELHIGGVQLARGYLNRPDLTQEKFISDPYSTEPGARLYKTGDLVRFLTDGAIEYLGRIDQQVKLRGLRIELGEIETVLMQQQDLSEAVVVVKEVSPGHSALVAYVVPRDFSTISHQHLIAALKQKLPAYMVPTLFQSLDTLPLLPNGKVNRRALPEPDLGLLQLRTHGAAPATPSEQKVAEIWSQVLGMESLGREDNFFHLGGQSLLAIRIMSRIRETFQTAVPLQSLFHFPTVSEFAAHLDLLQQEAQGDAAMTSRIPRIERRVDLPLSYGQQQMWLLEQMNPNTAQYNLPVPLRLKGKLNREALAASLQSFVDRHEMLRATFDSRAGHPVLNIAQTMQMELAVEDVSALSTAEQEQAVLAKVMETFLQPFDLKQGPLYRFCLISRSDEDYVLAATFHHLVFDGGSLRMYLDELVRHYEARVAGRELLLQSVDVQYVDYAAWHNQRLQQETAHHLAFWTRQLANLSTAAVLKPDLPRRADGVRQGELVTYLLPSEKVEALERFSRNTGVTLFMTTFAAFQLLLFGESGQTDIAVGTPVEHRDRSELEPLVGYFVNTLVLRTDLSGNPTFASLLEHVREVTTTAYQHQVLPYEMIVSALQTKQEASALFQVLFVLHGQTDLPRQLTDGLCLEHYPIESRPPKFDLHFDLEPLHGEIVGTVTFDTGVFKRRTIENFVRRYQRLLDLLLENPTNDLASLLEQLQQAELDELRQQQSQAKSGSGFRKFGKR